MPTHLVSLRRWGQGGTHRVCPSPRCLVGLNSMAPLVMSCADAHGAPKRLRGPGGDPELRDQLKQLDAA
eukprot:8007468-Alexandrium_andersonii.AAC.1